MKKMFDETRFGSSASLVIDVVWLGVLFCLCSLPVVTAGASACGAYYSMAKSVRRGRGRVTGEFFRAFKDNFPRATLFWVICLAVVVPAALVPALLPYYVLPAALIIPWIFPYLSRFSASFPVTVRTVFYLALKNPGRSLLNALVIAAAAVSSWALPSLIPLVPGAVFLAVTFIMEPVFRRMTEALEDDPNEDKWYNE